MPTLEYPASQSDFTRFAKPVGTNSRTQPSGIASQVATNITPNASDGNTVQDHLVDMKARMGHFTNTEVFKGSYSNSTTYEVGDEVEWTDPDSSQKEFFKRLVAGDDGSSGTPISSDNAANWSAINADIHNLTVKSSPVVANSAVAFRSPTGDVFFNRAIVSMLLDAQTSSEVTTAIAAEIAKVVTNTRWKGTWARGAYAVNDYVEAHGGDTYRCIVARTNADSTGPGGDTTGWVQVTGTELLVVQRVRDMLGLLAERLGLTPAVANRGHVDQPQCQRRGPRLRIAADAVQECVGERGHLFLRRRGHGRLPPPHSDGVIDGHDPQDGHDRARIGQRLDAHQSRPYERRIGLAGHVLQQQFLRHR